MVTYTKYEADVFKYTPVKNRAHKTTKSPLDPPSVTGSIQKLSEETRTTMAEGMAALGYKENARLFVDR